MARLTLRDAGWGFLGETTNPMQTIAQFIAARQAAAKQPAAVSPAAQPDLELEAAIDRIDPPGKRRAGLVLSAKTPLQPAETAEKAHHAALRSLSQPEGEAIPLTPCNASREVETWHEAMNAFESQLCAMRDPADSDVIWLAIRADRDGLPPILLHRLPWTLWDYPGKAPANQPFLTIREVLIVRAAKLARESAQPTTALPAFTHSTVNFTSAAASAPATSAKTRLDHSPTNKQNMKIRLETTNSEPQYSHAVEITVQQDDLNIHQLWEDVIVPALLGYGFQQTSIDEINQP